MGKDYTLPFPDSSIYVPDSIHSFSTYRHSLFRCTTRDFNVISAFHSVAGHSNSESRKLMDILQSFSQFANIVTQSARCLQLPRWATIEKVDWQRQINSRPNIRLAGVCFVFNPLKSIIGLIQEKQTNNQALIFLSFFFRIFNLGYITNILKTICFNNRCFL